ncbi:hypothetical protein [Mameliella sediminis]|uniref:hypothetical protein n=1 Tax=Mameliella sediminis TaxID=2836866 RepID=UPI001C45E6F5|nr:hypothetical protein [Mameliella sediminis]MBV7393180.1 hypothetical protein [Mameliella sediminis]MBY6114339.1 hypothetical protein [Antarctobacter heliothermus]MBY6143912.1 hypothetical protein [Mameliella alba]MCA0953962.1 hypothetical protein [Mameliella alba]
MLRSRHNREFTRFKAISLMALILLAFTLGGGGQTAGAGTVPAAVAVHWYP